MVRQTPPITKTKCCCGVGLEWHQRESHLPGSFDSGLAVRVRRLQRVRLGELSRWCHDTENTNRRRPSRHGNLTASQDEPEFLRSHQRDGASFRLHLFGGHKQPRISRGKFCQAIHRDLRHDLAAFGYGHPPRQHMTVKLWSVRVVVGVVAPRYLRMHPEQPRLRIDTLFRFLPPAPRGRSRGLTGTGEQNATKLCSGEGSG